MRGHAGFRDVADRLAPLSGLGDQLDGFAKVGDFEMFRAEPEAALDYHDRSKGGRPPFDAIMMFKILVTQAANNLSDGRAEFLINDRLSFMRFLELGLADKAPNAKTIWMAHERLTKASAIDALFARCGRAVREAGYIPMSGQIVDASLVSAPKQRNTEAEKAEIEAGRVPAEWAAQHWTLVFGKAREREDGKRHGDIAIPVLGYKSRASIDRRYGFIRRWDVTDADAHDGRVLREGLLDRTNTGSTVWADSAYRPGAIEAVLDRHGFKSHIHHRKPRGRAMPPHIRRVNAARSAVRAAMQHVFAHQKGPMALSIRTIGIARAKTKIGLANLTYNIRRLVLHERRAAHA